MTAFSEQQQIRIAYMVGRGATVREIAGDLQIFASEKDIKFFCDRACLPQPRHADQNVMLRFELDRETMNEVDKAALKRKVSSVSFVQKLLTTVFASRLVDAVMDDAGE